MSDAVLANLPSKIVVDMDKYHFDMAVANRRCLDKYNVNLLVEMLEMFRKSILSAKELQVTNVEGAVLLERCLVDLVELVTVMVEDINGRPCDI